MNDNKMNDNDTLFLDLMKNPYKSKKKKVEYNLYIDKLHIELIKKFSDYNIDNNLYKIILKKIEILLNEHTIKTMLYDIVEQIENES
tara:strand:- start:3783 stop:4043 length:261 start_codon:yes stop_codon:yes gene_type:complete